MNCTQTQQERRNSLSMQRRSSFSSHQVISKLKCVILGDGHSGKSSLMKVLAETQENGTSAASVFNNFITTLLINEKNYHFEIWTTSGRESYDRLRLLSYHDANLFVICFSLIDSSSLKSAIEKYIPEILSYRADAPFILVGTKYDVREKVPIELRTKFAELTSFEQGLEEANKLGADKYVEVSAIDVTHVRQLFLDMIQLSLCTLEPSKNQKKMKNKCIIL